MTIIGNYNKGKSFLINNLSSLSVDEGFAIHTLGPALIYSRLDDYAFAILDSAGFEVPIENGKLNRKLKLLQKQITEEFQREFLIESSDILIIVVGILSISEQKMINLISKQYGARKKYVIHNFYQLSTKKQIIQKIQSDILYAFNAIPINFPNPDS